MSVEQLTAEPSAIYAGDTLNWLISVPDYLAPTWTLKYKAVSATGYFAITSTASGSDHLISVAKATTAAYIPGAHTLVKYVENATELVTLAELPLTVKPALSGKTAAYDNRSHVKKVLDAIEATIEGRATVDQLELTIDGTTLKRMPVEQLLVLRSTYVSEYQRELQTDRLNAGLPAGSGRLLMRL